MRPFTEKHFLEMTYISIYINPDKTGLVELANITIKLIIMYISTGVGTYYTMYTFATFTTYTFAASDLDIQ